jgi:hypothetical protein
VRNESASALQALALLNNRFILWQAERLAARLEAASGDVPSQVRSAFVLTLGRAPTVEEQRDWSDFAARRGLSSTCRLLFNSNEFLFVN